ncbi:conserved hypothetical protein [Ricinus communis]|uniref:Uncharacterized protein n=1 Tax=Ricinus communis TaxID=3988 RepID=B9RRK0_RICCO|nr:conserved hypothetical protein [Ricinus communis]
MQRRTRPIERKKGPEVGCIILGQELKQKQEATRPSSTLTAVRTESNGRLGDSVKDYFLYFSFPANAVGKTLESGVALSETRSYRNRNHVVLVYPQPMSINPPFFLAAGTATTSSHRWESIDSHNGADERLSLASEEYMKEPYHLFAEGFDQLSGYPATPLQERAAQTNVSCYTESPVGHRGPSGKAMIRRGTDHSFFHWGQESTITTRDEPWFGELKLALGVIGCRAIPHLDSNTDKSLSGPHRNRGKKDFSSRVVGIVLHCSSFRGKSKS